MSNIILGPDGKSLNGPSNAQQAVIPETTQTFIRFTINERIEDLREKNQKQFADIEERVAKKWRKWFYILGLLTSMFGLKSFWLWRSIPQQIHEQLIEPKVTQSVNEALERMSADYIERKLAPLEDRVNAASREAVEIKKDILDKQQQLAAEQATLKKQFRLQERATEAKAGDIGAYEEIVELSSSEGSLKSFATAALHEIEIFYDFDAAQVFTKRWVEGVSRKDPGFSVDELLVLLHKSTNPPERIGMVNTLTEKLRDGSQTGSVGELFNLLFSETDLRVRARIIRALNISTKQEFRPLDKLSAEKWWEIHNADEAYKSPYQSLFHAVELMDSKKNSNISTRIKIINLLSETIEKDDRAIFAACLKASVLIDNGAVIEAEKVLADVKNKDSNFRWMHFHEAILHLTMGRSEEAIKSLNTTLTLSPAMERLIPSTPLSKLLGNPALILPSKKKS